MKIPMIKSNQNKSMVYFNHDKLLELFNNRGLSLRICAEYLGFNVSTIQAHLNGNGCRKPAFMVYVEKFGFNEMAETVEQGMHLVEIWCKDIVDEETQTISDNKSSHTESKTSKSLVIGRKTFTRSLIFVSAAGVLTVLYLFIFNNNFRIVYRDSENVIHYSFEKSSFVLNKGGIVYPDFFSSNDVYSISLYANSQENNFDKSELIKSIKFPAENKDFDFEFHENVKYVKQDTLFTWFVVQDKNGETMYSEERPFLFKKEQILTRAVPIHIDDDPMNPTNKLGLFNSRDNMFLVKNFSSTISSAAVHDLNSDGINECLVGFFGRPGDRTDLSGQGGGYLYVLSYNGDSLYAINTRFNDPFGSPRSAVNNVRDFAVLDSAIAVVSDDSDYFQSSIILFDKTTFELQGIFWNTGHLETVDGFRAKNGKQKIFVTGINNRFKNAVIQGVENPRFMAIFDPDSLSGVSPPLFKNYDIGTQQMYGFFKPNDIYFTLVEIRGINEHGLREIAVQMRSQTHYGWTFVFNEDGDILHQIEGDGAGKRPGFYRAITTKNGYQIKTIVEMEK